MPPDSAERLNHYANAYVSSGRAQRLEINLPGARGKRWFSVWIDLDRDTGGDLMGIVVTAVDVTEQKWREETLKTLPLEVAHRSKNLLAIIQSIATQTGRHSGSIDMFIARFRSRLQSLASSQDLVTSSNWRGANLYDLVIGQVGHFTGDRARCIHYEGERPYLNPNAALHVGLALHELAVNSVSYGALAAADGKVTVKIFADGEGEQSGLSFLWSEAIERGGQEIGQKRFGSAALERVVPASLNGAASLAIGDKSLEYRLFIPKGNFESE